jgi:MFS family permease
MIDVQGQPRLGSRCALIALTMFLVMTGATVPTPLYGLWAAQYGFGLLMITVIFSIYVIGVLIGLLALGSLSDVIGRRPVLLWAVAMSAASDAGYLLAHTLDVLFVARLLSGLATGLVAGTATAAMVDVAPAALRARASTTALIANAGGLAFGPVLGGVFAQHLRWPTHLVYLVHLILLAVAAAGTLRALGRGERRPGAKLRPGGLAVPIEIRKTFYRSAAAGGSGFAVAGLLNAAVGLFLVRLAGVHDLLLAGVIAALTFGNVAVGQLWGRRMPAAARLPVSCAVMVLACAINALSLARGSVELLVLGGIAAGVGTGLALGHGIAAINTECPEARRGETNSAFFAVMYMGLSVPVIGAGFAINALGLQTGGEIFSAAAAVVVAAVGVSLLAETRRDSRPELLGDPPPRTATPMVVPACPAPQPAARPVRRYL